MLYASSQALHPRSHLITFEASLEVNNNRDSHLICTLSFITLVLSRTCQQCRYPKDSSPCNNDRNQCQPQQRGVSSNDRIPRISELIQLSTSCEMRRRKTSLGDSGKLRLRT
ncbi:hypothetical protein AVEN_171436-1 [Araneus ventricosus]|uniref:Uncharacterized protein n=1 Tax=Araneus ventricosus TaxID=182803 RepID=A0A4Y2D2N5_ARAVE|nr:hypothetical protein AVEN_171436-1 [Araneus ventricosus]